MFFFSGRISVCMLKAIGASPSESHASMSASAFSGSMSPSAWRATSAACWPIAISAISSAISSASSSAMPGRCAASRPSSVSFAVAASCVACSCAVCSSSSFFPPNSPPKKPPSSLTFVSMRTRSYTPVPGMLQLTYAPLPPTLKEMPLRPTVRLGPDLDRFSFTPLQMLMLFRNLIRRPSFASFFPL